jgi:hypothetical protein
MRRIGYKQSHQAIPDPRQDKFIANKQHQTPLGLYRLSKAEQNVVA